MHLLGKDTLTVLQKKNEKLDKWIATWIYELVHARWWCSADVFNQFPKVQECSDGSFMFKTEPNEYCIQVHIAFPQGIALITGLTGLKEDKNE